MDYENEIIAMEEKLRAAMLINDADTLDRLISDDLLCTFTDGELYTKQQDIDTHRSGNLKFLEMNLLKQIIKKVGDTVVVSALMDMKVRAGEEVKSGQYRYTRVWARENGDWKIAVAHISQKSSAG